MTDGRDLLAATDADDAFDPETVEIADGEVLERLEPSVREWWVERFGEYVPGNGGFFTPPQREAIPLIDDGENCLVASPTGSGKCVRPDTPMVVTADGEARVMRAEELKPRRTDKLADVDETGELYDSDVSAYSLHGDDVETRDSFVYTEQYDGDLRRIETVYGREVEVTPDHPLLVERPDGREWVSASDVSEGDRIGVPKRIDLPSRTIEPDRAAAIEQLRERFPRVLTGSEADRTLSALAAAEDTADVSEEVLRDSLALAELSMADVSERLGVGVATVYNLVTGRSDHRSTEFVTLLRSEVESLDEHEILTKKGNGTVERFRSPRTVDKDIATFAAFVLAEGLIGEYERGERVMIAQSVRDSVLKSVRDTVQDRFGLEVPHHDGPNYTVGGSAFAVFISTYLGIETGRGRQVRFPDWVLNAPDDVKQAFVSTFLSLESEVRENEVRVTQANEIKIEQLNALLLSFGITCSRRSMQKSATNAENRTARNYFELAVRGKPNLRKLCAEFDVQHRNWDSLVAYADGGSSGTWTDKYAFDYQDIRRLSRYFEDDEAFNDALGNVYEVVRRSGYATEGALATLEGVLSDLPADSFTTELASEVSRRRDENIVWLEVTDTGTVPYNGEIVDLSVPDTHNFVGGRGAMYLHNTLSAFTAILNELFRREREEPDGLENSVYCLYVSPLKSLANDITRNLAAPIEGIAEKLEERGHETGVRQAIRHGDTPDSERQAMLEETPHVLNTTPETLAILLNSPKFKEKLRTVEYVVVDEIHSLAENKRGTHLAVSLERLERLCSGSPVRVGCSATVEPLTTMAEFLVGGEYDAATDTWEPRPYELVDTRFVREFDLRLECPTDDLIDTPREVVSDRFYDRLDELIAAHENTLVFTNTRSGAERVLGTLRERYGYDEETSGCHHGSMSKTEREAVEEKLKSGDIDVVTSSTSLELGIDMPYLDLVVQVGSPKSVASLLQRVGRAGHRLGQTVEGRVLALDRDELVECAVMLAKAEEGFVDRVFVPEACQDVAAQQVYGMAINGPYPEQRVRETLRSAYPYRDYSDADWEQLCRYLTADYEGLEEKNVYAKAWRDTNDPPDGEYHYEEFPVGEPLIGKRGRMARVIYMTNIGTIPDSFTIDVFVRGSDEWVGQLDEEYLDTLEKGDVFQLGGGNYEFRYRRGSKVYVDPSSERPTVPSWFSERLPLSYDLGREILEFQGELMRRLSGGGPGAARSWLRGFPLDENSVRAIVRMFDEQRRYLGVEGVSTPDRIVVEEVRDRESYRRHYHVHSNYGREFNDGLSRLVAYRCSRRANTNVQVAVADNGFTVSMPLNRKVDVADVLASIEPEAVYPDLRAALSGTDLLKRYFRINATRSLMILKRYKGYEKSAAQQQVSAEMLISFAEGLDSFAVMEETYREITEDKLNLRGIREVLGAVQAGEVAVVHHEVETPSPRAFGLATLMASDVVLAEDENAVLEEFHARVMEELGEDTSAGVLASGTDDEGGDGGAGEGTTAESTD